MKQCRVCKQQFEPTLRQTRWICKPCNAARCRAWIQKRRAQGRIVKKMTPEYSARYFADPAVKARRAERQRIYDQDPTVKQKNAVRKATRYAIKNGRLIREPCEACGNPQSEAHHDDYLQPFVVRWLCRGCHHKHHDSVAPRGKPASPPRDFPASGEITT